ncbi:hypothetical protein CXB51_028337 [Gossypium anomalum]|uniref:RNase H type-1 domain-containing protein n=1 Tax=Gossypium anomalum TaxID=47600 RepID=A0A8J5YYK0_9ROSI|nr:hypothetical protein CXB51_028337 [Gossypium anomalum]
MGSCFRIHNLFSLVFMVEAIAVLHDLQFVQEMRFLHVVLKRDSRIVILKLQSKDDYSEIRLVTKDVKALS